MRERQSSVIGAKDGRDAGSQRFQHCVEARWRWLCLYEAADVTACERKAASGGANNEHPKTILQKWA